jgi:hypothetical protein
MVLVQGQGAPSGDGLLAGRVPKLCRYMVTDNRGVCFLVALRIKPPVLITELLPAGPI